MQTLLIMRHAKSDQSSIVADIDRPLNERGLLDAEKMGTWLKQQDLIPDRIVSSPALRAKQTTQIVCRQLGIDANNIVWDDRVYEAGLSDLLNVISDHKKNVSCLMLTAHNPVLERLLEYLSKDEPTRNSDGKLLTAGAIATLDFGDAGISTEMRSGKLVSLARPKEI